MASSKRQFLTMYEESVGLLRSFKSKNDEINKSIGVQNDVQVYRKIKAEQVQHNVCIQKIDKLLQKLQQSYLDPDTARKVSTVKQQYKIQKDRREHLIDSISDCQESDLSNINQYGHERLPRGNDHTYHGHQDQYYQSTQGRNSNNSAQNFRNNRNPTLNTNGSTPTRRQNTRNNTDDYEKQTQSTSYSGQQQQLEQYDYQIQRKFLDQRNQALKHAQKTLQNVYNISKDTAEMANFQGEQLDIISDEIFTASNRTRDAVNHLKQANESNKKSKKKYITFSLLLLVAVGLILFFLMI